MNLFVDTSVWSLALRRDEPVKTTHVAFLTRALRNGDPVFTTGLILQELLQGFRGPRARTAILRRFGVLPYIAPQRVDHIEAAELRNSCRRKGVQIATIDALIAQLCIRHELTLLTTDRDFSRIASLSRLEVWKGAP